MSQVRANQPTTTYTTTTGPVAYNTTTSTYTPAPGTTTSNLGTAYYATGNYYAQPATTTTTY